MDEDAASEDDGNDEWCCSAFLCALGRSLLSRAYTYKCTRCAHAPHGSWMTGGNLQVVWRERLITSGKGKGPWRPDGRADHEEGGGARPGQRATATAP